MNLKISTGSDIFDDFLEGGYDKDIITTIYGPSGSGKTTLCMLASIARAEDNKKVVYIDTEGGFSIERFQQLAGDDFKSVLNNLLLLKPTNFNEQKEALLKLKKLVNEKIGLIIIDTLTIFYRLELARANNIREVNNSLIWQLSYLTEITRKKNIPVIITNQVYSDFNNKDDIKMVGGDILRYNSKCLIKLIGSKKNQRKASLISHRSIADGKELNFSIINKGIIKSN